MRSTVTSVEVIPIRIPLTKVVTTSNKTTRDARSFLVKMTDTQGRTGWGEGSLNPTFTDENESSVADDIDVLIRPAAVGRAASELLAGLRPVQERLGRRIAVRCAVSVAAWDLLARSYGVPLYVLLGGAARSWVHTVYHIGNFDQEAAAQEAGLAAREGFAAVKLKVGRQRVDDDLAAVRQVRERMRPEMRLYVDANQAWTAAQAALFVGAAGECGVDLVEQPVAAWDTAGLSRLGKASQAGVAADEAVFSAAELLGQFGAHVAPAAVVVKLLKAGGIEGVLDLLNVARLLRVQPFLAGMPGDTSVLSAALLNIALSSPNELPFGTAITPHFSKADVVRAPLRVHAGRIGIDCLSGPGLGIEVDEAKVAAVAS